LAGAAIAAAVVLGACTDQPPTAAAPRAGEPRKDWTQDVQWQAVGSADIPVPTAGALPWTSTGITVTDTGWVRVELTGSLNLELNAAYQSMCAGPTYLQPPFCPLGQPLAGTEVGPGGRRDFDDYLKVVVGIDRGNGPEFVTTGPFTDVPGFYGGVVHGPGTIMVARQGLGWTVNGLLPFDVKGQEAIRVDVVAGSGNDCSTGGALPNGVGPAGMALACAPVPPKLVLRCTPESVTRGGASTCTASAEPTARNFQVTQWEFEGGGFTVRPGARNPSGAASQNRSPTWAGEMATAGDVTVSAMVDGAAQTATAHIEVTPRGWPQDAFPDTSIVVQGCAETDNRTCWLRHPPTYYHDLARTTILPSSDGWRAHPITSGPNEGLWYVLGDRSPLHLGHITIYKNVVFDDRRDAFWRGSGDCTREDLWMAVLKHEETHIRFAREFWESRRATESLETLVLQAADAEIDHRVTDAFKQARDWLRDAADRNHFRVEEYPPLGCHPALQQNPR
jgi:hypothetical protein